MMFIIKIIKKYKQIINFLIVGTIATLIDWLIYHVLCNIFFISPYIANVMSFTIALVFNYYASSKWVFNFKNNSFLSFVFLSVLGLLLSELLLYIFIEIISIHIMLSKVLATCITMIFNFVTRKVFLEIKNI